MSPEANSAEAKSAGLRYVSDDVPGITRRRAGKGFSYRDPKGKTIHDKKVLSSIKALAIPPAWTDVWICPFENGHIQATGLDARGRKQYRYHATWRQVRDANKYEHMVAFAQALPKIRRAVARDLKQRGLPRTKVLAAIVQLLEKTLIRVGNEEYARNNKSFGLTTMRNRHAKIKGATVHFDFKGKSGIHHEIDLTDQKLVRVISKLQDLPGQELFQYKNENGEIISAGSADVNAYLKEVITGEEFTAKDFRTWIGTVLATIALKEFEAFETKTEAKHNIVCAIKTVAEQLGNTPSVCRKCYVHPAILDSYLNEKLVQILQADSGRKRKRLRGLQAQEVAVLEILEQCT
jgi:DNA topoisomerase-1